MTDIEKLILTELQEIKADVKILQTRQWLMIAAFAAAVGGADIIKALAG